MKNLNKKIVLVALIFSIITTYLIYDYINSLKPEEVETEYISIIVASQDIFPRTKITLDMLKEIEVVKESYISNSIQEKNMIIGMYSKDKIFQGEVIPNDRLMPKEELDLSLNIPKNKRAISVAVNEYSGVGDLIEPGDYVDVYVTVSDVIQYSDLTKLVLQNIQVLAISKRQHRTENDRQEIPNVYSVTLAVTPSEGEELVLGESAGSIKLALRPLEEMNTYKTTGVSKEQLIIN